MGLKIEYGGGVGREVDLSRGEEEVVVIVVVRAECLLPGRYTKVDKSDEFGYSAVEIWMKTIVWKRL